MMEKNCVNYDYDGGDSSQTNSCVNEIYKITSKQMMQS